MGSKVYNTPNFFIIIDGREIIYTDQRTKQTVTFSVPCWGTKTDMATFSQRPGFDVREMVLGDPKSNNAETLLQFADTYDKYGFGFGLMPEYLDGAEWGDTGFTKPKPKTKPAVAGVTFEGSKGVYKVRKDGVLIGQVAQYYKRTGGLAWYYQIEGSVEKVGVKTTSGYSTRKIALEAMLERA